MWQPLLRHAAVAAEAEQDARELQELFTKQVFMNWISLTSPEQLEAIKEKSQEQPQVIFKHSTRCSISSMVKNRLDRGAQPDGADFYFLDLIRYRDISNKISEDFNVYHESPQVMIIKNGESVYDESHSGIDLQEIESNLV